MARKTRLVVFLNADSKRQLTQLMETFNLNKSSVVSEALARFFHDESVTKARKRRAQSNAEA